MEINTIAIYFITFFGFFILPFLLMKCFKTQKKQKMAIICAFCFYLIALFIGVWGKLEINSKITRLTFDFSKTWFSKSINWNFSNLSLFDTVVNLVMLIPVGIFTSYFCHKKWKPLLFFAFLLFVGLFCGIFIEVSQFVLPIPRSVQLSDIVFNSISVLLGGLIGMLLIYLTTPVETRGQKYRR